MVRKRSSDPVEELRRQKLEKLEKCFAELESYKKNKLKLQYPAFFVPELAGEDCSAWMKPYKNIPKRYKKYYRPAKYWVDEIIENKEQAHYVIFAEEESENSASFLELGKYLKKELVDLAQGDPINLVGHSMGGLDIRSAILDNEKPTLNIKNVITVGTPNNGTVEAGLLRFKFIQKIAEKFANFKKHQIVQGRNLFSNSKPIKTINSIENRLNLLSGIDKFFVFMGLRDSTVKGSPKLDEGGIPEDIYEEKVKIIQTSSAEHSGKNGITQDPRLFLPIIRILCGIELEDDHNYGYIYRKLNPRAKGL